MFQIQKLFTQKNKDDNIYRGSAKNSLRSLKIQNSLLAPGIFTHSTRQLQVVGGQTMKNVQIDPQTTEIMSKKLNV